jgi:hypothetical protein
MYIYLIYFPESSPGGLATKNDSAAEASSNFPDRGKTDTELFNLEAMFRWSVLQEIPLNTRDFLFHKVAYSTCDVPLRGVLGSV